MFFYNSSSFNNQLINIQIGCGSMFSPCLDDNKYYVGNNGYNPHISWNRVGPIPTL
jgi:hypothetical protein